MGKRSSLHEIYIHTKTLMGNEFREVCKIFGKNQLPPVFQKTAKKKRSRTAPLGFQSAESAKNRLTARLWVRPPWVKRILKITPQIWRKTLSKIIISQIIIIDKIVTQTDPLFTG